MSFNIVELVKDQISDQLMGTLGNVLGTDSALTSTALSGALPGLLSGLTASASTPAGAGALFDSVSKQDDGLLGNMGNLLGGGNPGEVISQGSSVLSSVLGDGALGKLASVVSGFAGIGQGHSSSLMGMLAPIVIGVIKKQLSGGDANVSSMASMLSGQQHNINAAMPSGLSDQLQSSGFFDSIMAANAAESNSPAAAPAPTIDPQPAPAKGGLFKWLVPVVGLLIAGVLGMQFLGGNKVEDAVSATQDAASGVAEQATALSTDALQDLMPEGVDFGEITGNLDGVFSSAKDSLGGITDLDSAREAIPGLEDVTGKLGGLNDVIGGLPDAVKGPIGSIVQTGLAALTPLVEKVSAIPGVGEVITPVVEPLMAMLEGLAG